MWGHRVSVVANGLESGLTFAEPASLLVTVNSLFVLPVETLLMPRTLPGKAFHSSLPNHILSILQDPAQVLPSSSAHQVASSPERMALNNVNHQYSNNIAASAIHHTDVLAI